MTTISKTSHGDSPLTAMEERLLSERPIPDQTGRSKRVIGINMRLYHGLRADFLMDAIAYELRKRSLALIGTPQQHKGATPAPAFFELPPHMMRHARRHAGTAWQYKQALKLVEMAEVAPS